MLEAMTSRTEEKEEIGKYELGGEEGAADLIKLSTAKVIPNKC